MEPFREDLFQNGLRRRFMSTTPRVVRGVLPPAHGHRRHEGCERVQVITRVLYFRRDDESSDPILGRFEQCLELKRKVSVRATKQIGKLADIVAKPVGVRLDPVVREWKVVLKVAGPRRETKVIVRR